MDRRHPNQRWTPITGYEVQYRRLADPDKPVPDARYPAHVWQTVDGDSDTAGTDFALTATDAQILNLTEGASYEVRVRAVTRSGFVGTSGYAPIVKTAGCADQRVDLPRYGSTTHRQTNPTTPRSSPGTPADKGSTA